MPFYLVPFDLLLLSPLYLTSPDMYKNICVAAGNGGFVPWQAGWATALGRFQIVLGREVGLTFYGLRGTDEFVAPGDMPGSIHLVGVRSTAIELPIVELRPYRQYSANQSSALLLQVFTGVDIPRGGQVVLPAGLRTFLCITSGSPECGSPLTGATTREAPHGRLRPTRPQILLDIAQYRFKQRFARVVVVAR